VLRVELLAEELAPEVFRGRKVDFRSREGRRHDRVAPLLREVVRTA